MDEFRYSVIVVAVYIIYILMQNWNCAFIRVTIVIVMQYHDNYTYN